MAYISIITLPNGDTYDIKDAEARAQIASLEGGQYFLGVTTTELTDGATTTSIDIDGTATTVVNGNIAVYGNSEFIFNGTRWFEFGDLSTLGALAYEDDASASYTPEGEVSQPTTTATTTDVTVNSITDVGTLQSYDVTGETLTITAGTLPTKGADTTVVSSIDTLTTTQPTFTGTQATITVS